MTDYYPELTNERLHALAARHEEDIFAAPPDTPARLTARIEREAAARGLPILTRVPSSFLIDDVASFFPVPHYRLPAWPTLPTHFKQFGVTGGALFVTRQDMQLLSTFWDVAHAAGIVIALGDLRNLPLCTEIIREARVSAVIVEARVMPELAAMIKSRGLEDIVRLFVAIRGADERLAEPLDAYHVRGADTVFEIHLIPGHPVAYQSPELQGSDRYHLNDEYIFEFGDTTFVTGLHDGALPLVRFPWSAACAPAAVTKDAPVFTITV